MSRRKRERKRQGGYDRNTYWDEGDITRVAAVAGIHISDMSAILHRRRRVSVKKAFRLSQAAESLGYEIHWSEFANNLGTVHPAFYGDAIA